MKLIPDDIVAQMINRTATRAAIIGAAFGLCISLLLFQHDLLNAEPAASVSLIWQDQMRSILKSVCAKNGGPREDNAITPEDKADVYTFRCADGMSLRDTVVRIRP